MIDIGANLTNPAFRGDLDQVIERSRAAGIDRIVVTGTDLESSTAAAELARSYPDLLVSTAGVHPHDAKDLADGWQQRLTRLLSSREVKAVGETGLDFNRNYSPRADQIRAFEAQLEMARRLQRSVFVHDRESQGAVLRCLREHGPEPERVVIHCFTGTAAELDSYLEAGFYIGITGWICDERRGAQLRDLLPRIPDDRLMIETDAPFLLPRTIEPRPTTRRNEPCHLVWVARAVADARAQSVAEVVDLTAANARRFFDL